jgi:hypothetical protein
VEGGQRGSYHAPHLSLCSGVQVLGCMKIAGFGGTRAYGALGLIFLLQFFFFRIVIGGTYLLSLSKTVVQLRPPALWAWAGEGGQCKDWAGNRACCAGRPPWGRRLVPLVIFFVT